MTDKGDLLYDPTAEPRILAAVLAPRLASLEGTRAASSTQQGQRRHPDAGGGRAAEGALRSPRRRQAREGYRGAASPAILADLTTCDFVLVAAPTEGVHVVEYPRRHRVGAARHPDRFMAPRSSRRWRRSRPATGLADLPLALIRTPWAAFLKRRLRASPTW